VDARLVYLEQFFGNRRAVSITPALLTDYVASRQASKTRAGAAPSNRTINIELAILKRMLRLAYKHNKVLRVPPFDMLKEAPAREGFFEAHQYQAVRRQVPEDLRVAVAVAHTFGWRKSEILSLERRQLDLKAGTLALDPGSTKNGEARTAYLTPDLKAQLVEQVARVEALQRKLGRIVPALFPPLDGRHAGRSRRGFGKRWAKACTDAGVPGRLLHDFRRTAVRNLEARRGRALRRHEDHRA
jgi:integrase